MRWSWNTVNELFRYLDHNGFKVMQYGVRSMVPNVGFGVYAEVNHLASNTLLSLALPEDSLEAVVWNGDAVLWTTPGMDLKKSLAWSLNEVVKDGN